VLPRRFSDLSAFGRAIIATVAVLTVAITAVAFVASYNALYRLFSDLGLYGEWVTRAIPLLLDAAFIGGELAAILAGILRAITGAREISRGWPATVVLVCGALTIALNVVHAYLIGPHEGPLTFWRCLAAALPPGLMILAFQVDIAIVRWVMIALGRPLIGVDAHAGTAGFLGVPASQPQTELRWWERSEIGHSDQRGSGAGGGVGARDGRVRAAVEATLERLGPEQARALGPGGVAAETTTLTGVDVTERYVRTIMSGAVGAPRGGSAGGNGAHP
jgi:hypothetical protein